MKENEEKRKAVSEKSTDAKTAKEPLMGEQEARKKLEEMGLLDDFLFGSVVTYPEIGEKFVRILLKIIFGREFKHLSVTAQKVFYGADTNLHGTRLDVYMEPEMREGLEEHAAVYDIEPDQKDSTADKKALPRRMRFYHAKIAARSLNSGADYDKLKNVIIVMIMPYDPFGLDRMVYTVKNQCVEVPEMPYEDGASTLFLYTKGTQGVPNKELEQLLHYMEDTRYENAMNEDLREIHRMVETVKKEPETMLAYIRFQERMNRSRAEGRSEGIEQGRLEGKAAGNLQRLVSQICKKLKKNKTLEEIAEDLEEEISVIEPIYNTAKNYVPDYDPDLVIEQMNVNN